MLLGWHMWLPNENDADSNGPPVTSAFIGELERFLMVEDSSVDVLVWWKVSRSSLSECRTTHNF